MILVSVLALWVAEPEQEEESFGETCAITKGKHLTWIPGFAFATPKRTLIVGPDEILPSCYLDHCDY